MQRNRREFSGIESYLWNIEGFKGIGENIEKN